MANDPIHHALYQRIQTDNDLCERMLPLRNIVQMLVLHCKSTDKYLVVANTHLYSQPDADDIRIVQAAIILNQIHSVIDRTIVEHKLDRNQVSAIFCGDMNSEPSDPIHQLVTHGIVQCECSPFTFRQRQTKISVFIFCRCVTKFDFRLLSKGNHPPHMAPEMGRFQHRTASISVSL